MALYVKIHLATRWIHYKQMTRLFVDILQVCANIKTVTIVDEETNEISDQNREILFNISLSDGNNVTSKY